MGKALRRSCALLILLLASGLSRFREWVRRRLKRQKPLAPERREEVGEGE